MSFARIMNWGGVCAGDVLFQRYIIYAAINFIFNTLFTVFSEFQMSQLKH